MISTSIPSLQVYVPLVVATLRRRNGKLDTRTTASDGTFLSPVTMKIAAGSVTSEDASGNGKTYKHEEAKYIGVKVDINMDSRDAGMV